MVRSLTRSANEIQQECNKPRLASLRVDPSVVSLKLLWFCNVLMEAALLHYHRHINSITTLECALKNHSRITDNQDYWILNMYLSKLLRMQLQV